MSEVIDGYVTTYALSKGTMHLPLELQGSRAMFRSPYGGLHFVYGERINWHRTLESANRRAEEMRIAKIASLRKSIARLEKLTFADPQP